MVCQQIVCAREAQKNMETAVPARDEKVLRQVDEVDAIDGLSRMIR